MNRNISRSVLAGLLALSLASAQAQPEQAVDADYQAFLQAQGEASWINANAEHPLANEAYRPIPPLASFPADTAKRDLGFALFHDSSLSRDGTVGCNSCHMGMMGGTDGLQVARGIDDASGLRNTPTVFNSAFNFRQFWDGRAFDLDTQALEPISNPVEMGHDLDAVVASLRNNPRYTALFAQAYPDGVTAANLGNALAQHLKDMTRTDSAFNNYLSGKGEPLSEQAQRGQERFNALGCVACHNGINLGGNSYQPVASRFTTALQYAMAGEEGLAARSGREEDRLVFKVPQLHNVAMTAPYYHDGSVATLEDAIRRMAAQQSGRSISEQDVADIGAFLDSLSSAFFGGMQGMGGGRMQQMMREQMPDRMGQGGGMGQGGMMRGGQHQQMHQQHMQQMQRMQHEHPGQDEATDAVPANEHQHGGV